MDEMSSKDEVTPGAMDDCIDWCSTCHDICTQTANYALGVGGTQATQEHIRILLDCAEICQASADFMLRESDVHGRTCAVCAEICDRCAEACERFGDDEVMQACADTCRGCAESCREVARVAHAA